MNNMSFDAIVSLALFGKDPLFYAAKEALRREFPGAHMIELAEDTLTIVTGAETIKLSVRAN